MGLRVNSNIASLNAQRSLSNTTERLQANYRRLSTGLRISTASDDAAGLAISERFRAQIRSTNQAVRNAQDGISLTQTGEGALNEVSAILIRMRELSTQAANGTVSSADRTTLNQEFVDLINEIDRIAQSTSFNGTSLLNATTTVSFQVGIGTAASDTVSVVFGGFSATTLGVGSNTVTTQANATTAITALDTAIGTVSADRAKFGAAMNRFQTTISNIQSMKTNLSAANSRIKDVDVAEETASMARSQVLSQAGAAVLAQANQSPQLALGLLRG